MPTAAKRDGGRALARNINALRTSNKLTQQEFADIAGVSRQAVVDWEAGKRKGIRQNEVLEAITSHFGVTEQDLVDFSAGFYAKLHGLEAAPSGAIAPAASAVATLPLLGRIHAGEPTDPEEAEGVVELPASVAANHPNAYFVEVEGDCMDRVYPEGCYVLVDPDREPQDGSVAAVAIDGADYVMRRLKKGSESLMLVPESSNSAHRDILVTEGDGKVVSLVGTVVWFQAKKEMG